VRNAAQAIVYLHGFRSSPASAKAGQLRAAIAALDVASRPALFVPELSHRPALAMAEIDRIAAGCDPAHLCFVGSSLGGFYAIVAAERHGARAVLINPAIRPDEALATHAGVQTNLYTGAAFEVTTGHFAELRSMRVRASRDPTASSCWSKPATSSSTIARPSRSAAVRGNLSAAAEITDFRPSASRFRPYCALLRMSDFPEFCAVQCSRKMAACAMLI
jgi:predicted esterase YcpF (UPF0227 family)